MATADDYAQWIVSNADKKGTPEFDTVVSAYRDASSNTGDSVKPYDVNSSLASAMNAGQALTFGFGDEIAGKLGLDPARYRKTVDTFTNQYPAASAIGSVSGSILGPSKFAKALKAFNPWATAGAAGGLYGMLQGAGDAEEGKTLEGATKSGTLGMLAAPVVMGTVGAGGSVLNALGGQMASRVPGVGNKYSEWLARNRVAGALNRDNVTADELASNMARLGSEARVADAAGESTRGALDLNANLPGKTANELEGLIRNRISTRPDRMDDVVYAVNGGYGRAGDLSNALLTQRAAESAPLYKKAHQANINPDPQLIRDLEAAKKLGAFAEAEKRSLANPEMGPFTLGASQQQLGQGQISVRDIDHIKQGIDTLIEGQTDTVTGKVSGYGRDLLSLKNRILSQVDTAVPDYAKARQAYAGPSALNTAINKGRAFWREDAESLSTMMQGMTNSEKEAFRVGASEQLREMVGNQTGQNRLLNFWKDRTTREKLNSLLGDDVKYKDVERMLKGEETLKRLEGLGPSRNSRTFSREANAEQQTLDTASDLVSAGLNIKTGGLASLLGGLGKYTARVGTPEPVRDYIGKVLMSKYSTDEINALRKAQEAIAARKAAAASAAGASVKDAGGLLDF